MKKRIAVLLAAGGVLATAVVALPAAQAHGGCGSTIPLVHGEDFGCVENVHTTLRACDREVDGNRVRAWWRSFGGERNQTPWAPSGGCASGPLPGQAAHVRLCEEDASCSDWVNK